MLKINASLLFLFGVSLPFLSAQTRYLDPVFSGVIGESVTYSDVNNLEMDIYQPEGDTETNRPLIVFAHGGAFYAGSKDNPTAVDFCTEFARRGYVTASINYRLAPFQFFLLDSLAILDQAIKAVGDAKAAIRYFRKSADNGNPYGIDPARIYFGGNSAGAIIGVTLAALDSLDAVPGYLQTIINNNGGLEGNSGHPGYPTDVKAVINLAGGINYLSFLDIDTPPIGSCHGDMDGVVPFDCNDVYWAHPQYGALDLVNICGSSEIHPVLDAIGVENELKVFVDADHTPWGINTNDRDEMIAFSVDFLYRQLDQTSGVYGFDNDRKLNIFPNPAREQFSLRVPATAQAARLEIRDLAGRLIRVVQGPGLGLPIERNGEPAGCYFLRLVDESGAVLSAGRLIIQ